MTHKRMETGIPRLDYILEGGLPCGNLHLIYGPSGSGKTVAANQISFGRAAKHGQRVVYLTVAAESHAKIIKGVRGLEFFDAGLIGEYVSYVSGYSALRDDGPEGLLSLLRDSLQRHDAELLVLDGIQTVQAYCENRRAYRAWLHLLQSTLTMTGTEGILLASSNEKVEPEATVADSLIELTYHLVGPRFVRELVVYKLRGSGYLPGRHQIEIDERGMRVHPRTEIQFARPSDTAVEERERMGFGIDDLDQMLHGGVLSGSATAVLGSAGTGRTTLGLSFLAEGARQGQKGFYFGFDETPTRLVDHGHDVGLDLQSHIDDGLLDLQWRPPLEHFVDEIAESILCRLRDGTDKRPRLFIDGLEGLIAASVYEERMSRFLSAFVNQLRTLDATSLISEQISPGEIDRVDAMLLPVVENAVLLQSVRRQATFHRLVSVIKMRESAYERHVREFDITEQGFRLAEDHASAAELLGPGGLGADRTKAAKDSRGKP